MRSFKRFIPYRDRPLCFIDIEGTGTNPNIHEVTEIGIHHSKKGGFCIQIQPEHISNAEPEALKISRYNAADWIDAKPLRFCWEKVLPFIENSTIIGHNIHGYDIPMLRGNLDRLGISHDDLFRDTIDTMSLARAFLVPIGLNMIGMKSCMKFIGEEYSGAHNAYEDTLFAEKLYNFIMDNLKWHGKLDGKAIQESLF